MSTLFRLTAAAAAVWLSGCGGAEGPEPAGHRPPAELTAAVDQPRAPEIDDARKHRLNAGSYSAVQAERFFALVESIYSAYFPGPQVTAQMEGWAYRHYPRTGAYLAVIGTGVFVFGGPFGTQVTSAGLLTDYVGPPDRQLTALQQVAEDLYRVEGFHLVSTVLTPTGRPPAGAFAGSLRYSVAQPLSADPQRLDKRWVQLGSSLPARSPTNSTAPVIREFRLVDGRAVPPATELVEPVPEVVRLWGDTVVTGGLAADGTTYSFELRLSDLKRVPLSGRIADAPEELRRTEAFANLFENPALLRSSATWAPGSAYFRRVAAYHGERLVLQDCRQAQSGAPLTSCASNATLESRFPLRSNGATYALADGVVQRRGEFRVWIANRDEPGASFVGRRAVLAERGGEIYRGTRHADGALIYGLQRPNVTVGFTIRLNDAAMNSLRTAATF